MISLEQGRLRSCIGYALVIAFAILGLPSSFNLGGGAWEVCLDYVGKGTLYGGQPFCNQGPVIYFLLFFLFKLFSQISEWLPLAILAFASHAVIYISIRKMVKEDGLYEPRLYAILYYFIVYQHIGNLTSSVATAFMAWGIWRLRDTRGYGRASEVGMLFSLAVFTKYTTAMVIIIALGYEVAKRIFVGFGFRGPDRGIRYNKTLWPVTMACVILAIIGFSWMGLNNIYPNFSEYTLKGHADQLTVSVGDAIDALLAKRSLNTLAGALMLAGIFVLGLKKRFDRSTLFYPMAQITIVAYSALFLFNKHYIGDTRIGENYMLVAYPYLLGCFLLAYKRDVRIFTFLVAVTMIYPSFYVSPLTDFTRWDFDAEKEAAIRDIQWGMHFIPAQSSEVLTEGPVGFESIFVEYDTEIDPENVIVVGGSDEFQVSYADADWTPTLSNSIDLNGSPTQITGNTTITDMILSDIRRGRYSLIMYGPPAWAIIYSTVKMDPSFIEMNFCRAYTPNLMYGGKYRSHNTYYFKNELDCGIFKQRLYNYYVLNFTRFCHYGENVGNAIIRASRWNQMQVPYSCNYDIDWLYSESERIKITRLDILITVALMMPLYGLVIAYRRFFPLAPDSIDP